MTSRRQVELAGERLEPPQVRRGRVPAPHRAQHAVVPRLERDVQVPRDRRGLPQRSDQPVVDVVDLDRAQAQAVQAGDRAGRPHQARQVDARDAVAEAAEVDARQDDLAVALTDPAPNLVEHGVGTPAAGGTAHERNHAEPARERTAVLDPDEGPNALEPRLRPDTADRADVAGDERGGILGAPGDDHHVRRQARETGPGEVGRAPGHVDALVRPRGPRRRLAALRDRLVRHAAAVDHRDLGGVTRLLVAVGEQPLPDRLARPGGTPCNRGNRR